MVYDFTGVLKFFVDMDEDPINVLHKTHWRCCHKMKYEKVRKGRTVFNYNAQPDKFYIILKGSVLILIPRQQQEVENEIQA